MGVEEAITRALREVGLPDAYAPDVRRMLEDPVEAGRECCGGFCDPCVTALRRAADRARSLMPP